MKTEPKTRFYFSKNFKLKILFKSTIFLSFFLSFFLLPNNYAQNQFSFDEYMGVNWQASVPPDKIECVGIVREYSRWFDTQNEAKDPNVNLNDIYPYGCLNINPLSQGVPAEMDYLYNLFNGFGMEISPAMMSTIPAFTDNNINNFPLLSEQWLPIQWIENPNNPGEWIEDPLDLPDVPTSYLERADWMYHYIARYGAGSNTFNDCDVKICNDDNVSDNGGLVRYVESWNEPTRTWSNGGGDPRHSRFEPDEYAAMTSCDFDGHESTIQAQRAENCSSNTLESYDVGIVNAADDVSFVMGAPHAYEWNTAFDDLDCANCALDVFDDWIIPIKDWCATNRGPTTGYDPDDFFFDVFNFHQYAAVGDPTQSNARWQSPEQFEFRAKTETLIAQIETEENGDWADREVWVSEFGYDTFEGEDTGWDFGDAVTGNNTAEVLQAQWNARTFLELYAAGVDRVMVHDLRDVDNHQNSQAPWDQRTGLLLQDGSPKTSWFYTYSMKNILEGFEFGADESINCNLSVDDTDPLNGCVRIYRFDHETSGESIWAVWSPTHDDVIPFNVSLNIGVNEATGFRLSEPSIHGVIETINVNDGIATVLASETPIFLKEGIHTPIECPGLTLNEATCNSVSVEVDINLSTEELLNTEFQVWFGEGNITNPDFSALGGNVTQFNYHITTASNLLTLTGLDANTQYTIFVVPENENGIPTDGNGNLQLCSITVTTSNTESICRIPTSEFTLEIIDGSTSSNPAPETIALFDQQTTDFCDPNNIIIGSPWLTFSGEELMAVITFDEPYVIDQFYFYDENGAGLLRFEQGTLLPGGDILWTNLVDYFTYNDSQWRSLSDFEFNTGIKYLRITATSDQAKITELFICGRPVCAPNYTITESCSTLEITNSNSGCAVSSSISITTPGDIPRNYIVNESPEDVPHKGNGLNEILIPLIDYDYVLSTNVDGSTVSNEVTGTFTPLSCLSHNPLSNKGEVGCDFRTFSVHPADPKDSKVQVWLSTDGPFDLSLHPLASQPNAEMRVLDIQFGGFYNNYHVVVDNLEPKYYYMTYRFVNEDESSILYSKNFRPYCPKPQIPIPENPNQFAVDDSCRVEAILFSPSVNFGTIEIVEQDTKTSTPLTGALATTNTPNSGFQFWYPVQYPSQMEYLYTRWKDGTTTNTWFESIEELVPCEGYAQGYGNGEESRNVFSDLQLFPNPGRDQFTVRCSECISANILGLDGKQINQELINSTPRGFKLRTETLPVGMYFLRVKNKDESTEVVKFVIQR